MPRVIIMGFGKMGRIHARHLTELGVPWNFFDPLVGGGVRTVDHRCYSHAIVATPIACHFEAYHSLAGFDGRILIEKPVVVREEHLHVLDDPRVFPGVVERFNPAVAALQQELHCSPMHKITFHRTSATGAVEDIGIHDLDLLIYLAKPAHCQSIAWEGGTFIVRTPDVEARFLWHKSSVRQTRVECSTARGAIVADLHAQTVQGQPLGHRWPVEAELRAFLGGETLDAKQSHRLLCDCLRLRNQSEPLASAESSPVPTRELGMTW